MDLDHTFDWVGFKFFQKLLLACVIIGASIHFGLSYVKSAHAITSAPLPHIVVVGTEPALGAPLGSHFSTSTPERVIRTLTITDAIPRIGKFIAADLVNMKLMLYQDGAIVHEYPILTKGKPGSPYETPSGFYTVLTKEENHLNNTAQVYMPYSMQFYGNYFIHGWPYHTDGTPVASTYSGGCIRLSTNDAARVFAFADAGIGLFVYDPSNSPQLPSLALSSSNLPTITAESYLVADIDTGDVFLEKDTEQSRPIASLTKLMTALVANETIMFNKTVALPRKELLRTEDTTLSWKETFVIGDLLYPLLMESNNAVADRLAQFYGTAEFVEWMNTTAEALGMQATHFVDASGISSGNMSTPDDLYRLAKYLITKKSFIFDITRTPVKTLFAESGNAYHFNNFNIFSNSDRFVGGKVGQTAAAGNTMISLFLVPVNGASRRVAIIVLNSEDYTTDTTKLSDWFTLAAGQDTGFANAACAACASPRKYRQIQ
jgi:D-alanyl-D-alanine carboxypeptidase